MPQAIDIVNPTPPAPPRAQRAPRGGEVPSRFKDAIERRTRRPEAKPEETAEAQKSAKTQKPAAKKVDKTDDAEIGERPASGVEAPEETTSAKPTAELPADDNAGEIATEADAADADGANADSDTPPDASGNAATLLALLAAAPNESATAGGSEEGTADAVVASASMETLSAVGTKKSDTAAALTTGVHSVAAASPVPNAATPDAGAHAEPSTPSDIDPADAALAGRALSDTVAADASQPSPAGVALQGKMPEPGNDIDAVTAPQIMTAEAKPASAAAGGPLQAMKIDAAPEQQFIARNEESIVTTIRGHLMPTGGSMKIRLDPPNMGQLQIDVTVARDGTISAAFQTSNEDAAKLLSHSLQHLKTSIENAGVAVDRIQVRQATPGEQSSSSQNNNRDQSQQNPQDHPARQEQQRREMLERMWAKLSGNEDPLDLVA